MDTFFLLDASHNLKGSRSLGAEGSSWHYSWCILCTIIPPLFLLSLHYSSCILWHGWKESFQAVSWTEQTKEFVYSSGSEEGKEETAE